MLPCVSALETSCKRVCGRLKVCSAGTIVCFFLISDYWLTIGAYLHTYTYVGVSFFTFECCPKRVSVTAVASAVQVQV